MSNVVYIGKEMNHMSVFKNYLIYGNKFKVYDSKELYYYINIDGILFWLPKKLFIKEKEYIKLKYNLI
jgi:hypothetical protein